MKKRRRFCQSFEITLPDGEVVKGRGQFIGPITDKDRQAIAEVAAMLKKITHAESITSVMLTKPDLPKGA
jgi:hypothetical protein